MSDRPLSGVRVLDLSRVLAGPWATQMLADLGAEVIKVENPDGGDDTRGWGPPYLEAPDGTAVSAYFLAANRGKRSVTIDFTTATGQALIHELATTSDVFVENFKVGGLAKYGLDYGTLRTINPRLVYCSITGFGQDGPYAGRPGYDFVAQGMGGLMSITGQPDSEGGQPTKVGVALVDIVTGLYASNAILAALRMRDRTGTGQQIDIALLDTVVATLGNQALNYLVAGDDSARLGNAHPSIVPYETFPTQDQQITVAVGNDAQFQRLCGALTAPELASDARFATNALRVKHRKPLVALLCERLLTQPASYWLAAFQGAGIPSGAINTVSQVFADPQVRHRGMQISTVHDQLGPLPGVANPIKFSDTPITYDLPPPMQGEHNQEVFDEIRGKSDAAIDDHIGAIVGVAI